MATADSSARPLIDVEQAQATASGTSRHGTRSNGCTAEHQRQHHQRADSGAGQVEAVDPADRWSFSTKLRLMYRPLRKKNGSRQA